jgi:hypothetical protein
MIESTNNAGPSRKDSCHGRHYALNYFVIYLQPVHRAASLGFSTLIFSAHSLSIERPSFFSRLCEPASSDAKIEASI